MNLIAKIIITDTNIITDLNNAKVLDKFVKLDNVYISDMVKNDEINFNTGNLKLINKIKTLNASSKQIIEIFEILKKVKGLSRYDIINYILARDNNAILATGDQKLKNYAEENGIQVIRTLKIIKLMYNNGILSVEETIDACVNLKNDKYTRIPLNEIENLINEIKTNQGICD